MGTLQQKGSAGMIEFIRCAGFPVAPSMTGLAGQIGLDPFRLSKQRSHHDQEDQIGSQGLHYWKSLNE